MTDIVSVIIPTYGSNTDPCRAIDSALSQDYGNVEVIVVDDNGKGTTQQIINQKSFQKYNDDKRFTYLVQTKNLGGSVARNAGVEVSHGKYLCFLDDDDELSDPRKLTVQVAESQKLGNEWAGTYSSCEIFKGNQFVRSVRPENSGCILEEYMLDEIRIETAAPVIKRTAYDAVSGFDGSFKRHQDWEFFSRILDKYKLKATPEVTYSRYYKIDAGKRSPESRLEYMNHYAESMRSNIVSIPENKLERIIKRKYIAIVFVMFRTGKIQTAFNIMKSNHFDLIDYYLVVKFAISYVFKRAKYGSHF